MISRGLVRRIWGLIDISPEQSPEIAAHQLDGTDWPSEPPLLAVDSAGLRHLLIPVHSNTAVTEDRRSAGIHIRAGHWMLDAAERRFIDVTCVKPHLNDLFDIIVFEILSEISLDRRPAGEICAEALNRWRELLSYQRGELPNKDRLVGVWGELWFLRQMAAVNPGVLRAWTGPQGARFDFNAGAIAVEVKTTLRRHGLSVFIHGHDQLDAPATVALYLAVIRIEEVPNGGQSLSAEVEALAEAGVNRTELLLSLAKAGFTPDVIAGVENMEFRLLENRFYRVDDQFPKIVPRSFVGGNLPAGIVTLTYELDLTNSPPVPLNPLETDAVLKAMITGLNA